MSAKGLLARGVPPQPKWLLYVKIAILVLSVIILALAAYSISVFSGYGYYGGGGAGGYLIFIVIKTWIIYGLAIFIELRAPHLYYRIAALIVYILSCIFWLSAWAWSASLASFWLATYCNGFLCGSTGDYGKQVGGALAGCAALGAVTWILVIINLVFLIKGSLADPEGDAPAHQAELGQLKQPEAAPAPVAAAQPPYNNTPYQEYPQQPAGQYPQQGHQQTYATQ